MFPTSTLVFDAVDYLSKSSDKIENAQGQAALDEQIARDDAHARLAAAMARVQQELAIATRIATADEVTIEEFYDGSGEGSLGVKLDENNLTLGAAGAGRRVTKRTVRFKGWREGTDAALVAATELALKNT